MIRGESAGPRPLASPRSAQPGQAANVQRQLQGKGAKSSSASQLVLPRRLNSQKIKRGGTLYPPLCTSLSLSQKSEGDIQLRMPLQCGLILFTVNLARGLVVVCTSSGKTRKPPPNSGLLRSERTLRPVLRRYQCRVSTNCFGLLATSCPA